MMEMAINGTRTQWFKDYKKTDTSIQEGKPVTSGQSQISEEKAKNPKNGLRIWKSEVVDQNVQVDRLGGRSQGRGS